MKNLILILVTISLFSCFNNNTKQTTPETKKETILQNIMRAKLQQVLDWQI